MGAIKKIRHHFPKPDGDRLYFKRDQVFVLGCLGSLALMLIAGLVVLAADSTDFEQRGDFRWYLVPIGVPFLFLILLYLTKGYDFAIDRRTGEVLHRKHFLGVGTKWKRIGGFESDGYLALAPVLIAPPQPYFQVLCKGLHTKKWSALPIYFHREEAEGVLNAVLAWEPRLTRSPEITERKLQSELIFFYTNKRIRPNDYIEN